MRPLLQLSMPGVCFSVTRWTQHDKVLQGVVLTILVDVMDVQNVGVLVVAASDADSAVRFEGALSVVVPAVSEPVVRR